jgi:glycine/D-amino acid oxidase-like deaminating enzyme/nitrite reductase/ring-hydroxylating ferredoxin subunit
MNALDEHSKPYWASVPPLKARALDRSLAVDVAVVGSGIAGTSVAYELAARGVKLAVLDRGKLGRGMTARTSAHLAFQSDDLYQEVISRRGLKLAKLHYRSQRAAVDRIAQIQESEEISCDFARLDGLLGLAPDTKTSLLDEELKACHKLGYKEVEYVKAGRLARLSTAHGLKFPHQARFHPLKYVTGLHRILQARGAALHADTAVVEIAERGGSVALKTDQGFIVRAGAVVIATNSPIDPKVAIHTKQAPYRTYVFAAPVPKGSIDDALYWDTADPYHYVRLQPEKSYDLLIAGGEDHRSGEADDALTRYRKLENWTRERFPEIGRTSHRWSGQILEPVDYTAFVGRAPGKKNCYVATGDSGQGLTHGAVAGMLIADLILEGSNPWEELHDPSRKTMNALGRLIEENVTAVKNLTEYVLPGELKSTRSCKRGQGGILRRGLAKLAVSRDRKGKLHIRSASCTHVGCIIHWNSFEQCWDCPCHGSHFAPDGSVLNAPAVLPLHPAGRRTRPRRS